jgi:hypothetical protein
MPLWKTILLRSAGFGAGFALMLSAIVGGWASYSNRPKPPKPWDSRAITAEYDYVTPYGDKNYLTFYYALQNNTDNDYRIDGKAGIEITGKLKRENAFDVTVVYPIFVPAKSRVSCSLQLPYQYPGTLVPAKTHDEGERNRHEVAKYVVTELPNLDGFVLFDTATRYKIDFPSGWGKSSAAETTAQK